ncbi:MAG: TAXI family TRAP transporter solute-binding subunit [Rhodospirillales bacterium]|nr:TAXI family TRAP transporter solute-binding subunit [Rhodospirillales bacterium]
MRNVKNLIAVSTVVLAGLYGVQASAQVVGIATGQQGSLGYKTGQAVAKVANLKAGITARAQPMAGTAAYIPLINKGEVEFGFCNAVEAEYAFTGTGNFEGKVNPDLRIVGTMFPLKTGLMVVADSGIKSISDLKGKEGSIRIASEYKASNIIPYYIAGALANGGMRYDDFPKQVPVSSFVKGMEALGDDKVDLSLVSLGAGAGRKVDAKLRSRGGLRYVSLDKSPEGIAKFKAFLPAGDIVTIKANPSFPGLQEDANIVQIPWVLIANKNTPDDVVYNLIKAIATNKEDLGKSFGAFKGANAKTMAPANKVPYHPGALKYYAEAGIKVGG